MNKRELDFRKDLIERMGGRWYAAIHVENHLNPGVPDMSYVMVAPGHETGWLELKAAPARSHIDSQLVFKVESSQHQWMIKYARRVPCHFLIKICGSANRYYLVSGTRHNELAGEVSERDLISHATSVFDDSNLIYGLTESLQSLTKRDRNGY